MKPFRRLQARGFTLVELILSLGLMALLLAAIGFMSAYALKTQKTLDRKRQAILHEQVLWQRLGDILSRCCLPPREENKPQTAAIWLSSDSRVELHFRPIVTLQAELNLLQRSSLFLDEGKLIFETGPSPWLWDEAVCQNSRSQQVIAEGIQEILFGFLYIPSVAKAASQTPAPDRLPLAGWNDTWQEDWGVIPSAIAVKICQQGQWRHYPIWINCANCTHAVSIGHSP